MPQDGKTESEANVVKDGVEQGDKLSSSLLVPSSGTAASQSTEDFVSCKMMMMS